jgi:hypothetical protein
MLKAIIWKELREQGLIALTLVVLGAGVLVAAATLADPPSETATPADVIKYLGAGLLATLMLAVTAGIVCGGAVFAAEREAGTFSFLESLPTTRWELWQAKLLAGLGLAVAQIGLLVAVAAALGLVTTTGWAVTITVYALLAFVWGTFGSTTAQTTLGSVGIAIPAASLTAFVALIPLLIFFQNPATPHLPRASGAILFLACMFAVPLVLSAWLFTGLDRTRAADDVPNSVARRVTAGAEDIAIADSPATRTAPRPRRSRFGLVALLWLSTRQVLVTGLVLSGFALLFGLILLSPAVQPFVVWPALALMAGVLTGVTAFADEQTRGAARYWGEQRLPIGRLWLFKIGVHLVLCLWLLVLLALPLAIRSQVGEVTRGRSHTVLATVFRAPLFDELGRQGWKYLFVPAVYGFAAGHLCGLIFRKLVVACGVAGIVGGVGAAAWGPSLLAGGVKHWQLWLPPLVALLTARLLLRAWAADRAATRASLTTLAGGCAVTVLVLATGIGYRVLEIPDEPGGEDDIAFVAALPPFDKNEGGRDFKIAAEQYARLATATSTRFDGPEARPGVPLSRRERVEERLERVPRFGWPAADAQRDEQLEKWLDAVFAKAAPGAETAAWHELAAAATGRPIGIYEYPNLIAVGSPTNPLENARRMAVALLARGLQRQAEGDADDFLARLRTTLTLARTLRSASVVAGFQVGVEVERLSLVALDRWLDRLPPQADKLRAAAGLLAALEPTGTFDPTPHFLAERYLLREAMKAPAQWLPNLITPPGGTPDATTTEVDLVGVAWAVPWEKERTRRLIGLGFESGMPSNPAVIFGRPGTGLLIGRVRHPADLIEFDRQLAGLRRGATLKAALRAYRADKGRYPDALPELVAAQYLTRLPPDPYDEGRTFGYRVVPPGGLAIPNPIRLPVDRLGGGVGGQGPPTVITIPAGQAMLWSVGPDKHDDGGKSVPVGMGLGPNRPPDIVYLVPTGL